MPLGNHSISLEGQAAHAHCQRIPYLTTLPIKLSKLARNYVSLCSGPSSANPNNVKSTPYCETRESNDQGIVEFAEVPLDNYTLEVMANDQFQSSLKANL